MSRGSPQLTAARKEEIIAACAELHTGFYERYGWEFLCPAHEDESGEETRVYLHR